MKTSSGARSSLVPEHVDEQPAVLTVREFKFGSTPRPRDLGDLKWLDLEPRAWQRDPLLNGPLDLEIGCGVGWHPIQYATQNPARKLIAIEHTAAKFQSFQARVQRHPALENLFAVHADAVQWVSHLVADRSLTRVLILYPNPEPKAANKRWLRSPFMHELLRKLEPRGELILATNEQGYFQEALLYGREFWRLEIAQERSFTQATLPMARPRTHFEKKYLRRGQTCYDAIFRKRD